MSSGKKKLIIFSLLFSILAIPVAIYLVLKQQELRSEAQPATTLAFDPNTVSKTVGESFTLNVNINTGSNNVSGVELHIQYDTKYLTATDISVAGTPFLEKVLVDGSVGGGFGFITLGSQQLPGGKKGAGSLATITFRAVAATQGTPTLVKFTTDTRVAGATGQFTEAGNLLAAQPAPAAITINPVAPTSTPSPSPSPTPSPSPSPTPTGRPTGSTGGGGVGGPVPTPTPTSKVATGSAALATPTPTATATPTPISTAKGGGTQPTAAAIPVTADITPTTTLTIGGVLLFIAGIAALLAL